MGQLSAQPFINGEWTPSDELCKGYGWGAITSEVERPVKAVQGVERG
jgi:hypothetical protein